MWLKRHPSWIRDPKHRRATAPYPEVRRDYLTVLGEDVDAALALIVDDLVATGALPRPEAETAVRGRAADHRQDQVANHLDISALETAVWVAEAIQEDLIEGVGVGPRLDTWPTCPEHPHHPLWLRTATRNARAGTPDDPVWTCITTGQAVAELGQL